MNEAKKLRYYVFRLAMLRLSVSLVISALAMGLWQNRMYFTFAASAAGVILMGLAWREYLRLKDGKAGEAAPVSVPYILRSDRRKPRRKPAFLMNSADFDDDLTDQTVFSGEDFTAPQRCRAKALSCLLSGAAMIAISFVI